MIYEYDDYRAYIRAVITSRPKRGHGFRSEMARAMNCQVAYVSQVLGGKAEFSLEQAEVLNGLLLHSKQDADYFLLLIQNSRAGTSALRDRTTEKIKELQKQNGELSKRTASAPEIPESLRAKYYSSWIYAACHMSTTIPGRNSVTEISRTLNLPEATIEPIIKFLVESGILQSNGGKLEAGTARVYLKSDSPLTSSNHRNWRLKAMAAIDAVDSIKGLHFSGHFSMSRKDATRVREQLIQNIESVRSVVKESPEEELHTFTLDFFKIG